MTERVEHFTSRWGMLVAMLGMAVGTGNIWRFPRVVANNVGGSFLVAWVIFMLIWSVPLILVDASDRFLTALAGITDPEQKRKKIGGTFIDVFADAVEKEGSGARFLVQGTLYSDVIESEYKVPWTR